MSRQRDPVDRQRRSRRRKVQPLDGKGACERSRDGLDRPGRCKRAREPPRRDLICYGRSADESDRRSAGKKSASVPAGAENGPGGSECGHLCMLLINDGPFI
ncbi:hypothetical protein GCM10008026_02550 [Chelatococcus composti]|nr:hypothetical protein GCM10008026_02550 [Chelatococcus composti]